MKSRVILGLLILCLGLVACRKNDEFGDNTQVALVIPNGTLPQPNIPADNPLTEERIELGRKLFFDPLLSSDQTVSCATCHIQNDAFSDPNRFSTGVGGAQGDRQGMAIFNMAWNDDFFWDGRATTLREQAVGPIENPLEMNESLPNVVAKLTADSDYPAMFAAAFGDANVTADRIGLAMENFMFSIVSSDSKYDRFLAGNATLTASEERGRQLFFGGGPGGGGPGGGPGGNVGGGANCVRCHGGPNFDNRQFFNIGLDNDANISDVGRQAVTGNPNDRGKFKTVSLRNIAVSGPYMHDGRFNSLEQVLNFYNNGIQNSATLDPGLQNAAQNGMGLSQQDRADIIAFLNTLTDNTYLNNPAFSAP